MDFQDLSYKFSVKKEDYVPMFHCWLDGQTKGVCMGSSSYEKLTHSKWNCTYDIVFILKYRKKCRMEALEDF